MDETTLQDLRDGFWVRPKSYRGSGTAFKLGANGYLVQVPTLKGGALAMLPVVDLVADWEIVSPDEVVKETDLNR